MMINTCLRLQFVRINLQGLQKTTGLVISPQLSWLEISNEDFFPENQILSTLKMRLSYGVLGSQNVGDYAYQAVMNLNSNYDFGDEKDIWRIAFAV